MPSNIYLTGFMGSGKSHTGVRLAEQLGLPFVDLDEVIEQRAGCTISEMFAQQGEKAFRKLERDVLRGTADGRPSVVSTGGGAPCFHDGMTWMNKHGVTVFLDPPAFVLLGRLEAGRAHRPLLQSTEALTALIAEKLEQRRPVYERAQLQIRLADPEADVAGLLRAFLG